MTHDCVIHICCSALAGYAMLTHESVANVIDHVTLCMVHARCVRQGDCLIWTGAKNGGSTKYGNIRIQGKSRKTHRIVAELVYGPSELDVLHSCDNPLCCEPTHLRYGTHKENMEDKVKRGRQHRLPGDKNGRAKLTNDLVTSMREEFIAGATKLFLSRKYEISRAQVKKIVEMRAWV